MARRAGLRRTQHLSGQATFSRLLRRGRRAEGEFFCLIAGPSEAARPRLGVTISRRLGPAVVRNRIRRRVRELFRLWPPEGLDVVVQPKVGALTAEFASLRVAWLRAVGRVQRVGNRRGARPPATD